MHIKIKKSHIERIKKCDFLGLIINENLNWKAHIDKIANKILMYGHLKQIKYVLPVSAKPHIICALGLILSHFNFGISALGHRCEGIVKFPKKIVQITCLIKYNAHTEVT